MDARLTWMNAVSSDDPLDRVEALEAIPDEHRDELFPAVLSRLQDEDAMVRLAAAEALASYDLEEAREALRRFIDREQDDLAAGYGLSTLGLIAEPRDLRRLADELDHVVAPVRRVHAATGLATAALRWSGRELARQLGAPEEEVRHLAAGALVAMLQYVDPEVVRALAARRSAETDPGVLEKLQVIAEILGED